MIALRMKLMLKSLSLVGCAALLTPPLFSQGAREAVPSFAAARPLVVAHVDETQLTRLTGNTRPEARAKNDLGPASSEMRMGDLVLVLRRGAEQQAAFDAFVESQYDPTSPNYHQWLTPEAVGERFGPAQPDLDAVTNWLLNHGFTIDDVSKNHLAIRFSGTAAQVQEAFHTEIHNLLVKKKDGSYESHIANMSDPQIPSALTPVVVGVKALHNFFPRPLHRVGGMVQRDGESGKWRRVAAETGAMTPGAKKEDPKPRFTVNDPNNGLIEDITPYDFAAIYNVTPLWNAATPIDGTGQTVAIAGTANILPSDVASFRNSFGLPTNKAANTPIIKITNSDPGVTTTSLIGDRTENTLDVEWSGAVAKNAQIILVTSAAVTASTDALYLSEDYIVQNRTAQVMNVSYGACELFIGTAGNTEYNTLWQTAASEGIAVFVASGDSGSPSCDDGGDQGGANVPYAAEFGLSVSGLASSPYDTAVGGTDLSWCSNSNLLAGSCTTSPYWNATDASTKASAIGYIPEIPWNDTCSSPVGVAFMEYVASNNATGLGGVSDAESSCNFVIAYASFIYENYGVDLSGWVDTIGGGGGKSSCTVNGTTDSTTLPLPSSCSGGYAKPSWQTGVTGIPADGKRDIPDISFFASNGFLGSAYLICDTLSTDQNGNPLTVPCTYSATAEDTYQELGGTSVSSPAMAGVMALINQKAGSPQGNPNAELYKLAAKQNYANCSAETVTNSSSCVFHDINTGTNAMACDYAYAVSTPSPNCPIVHSGDELGILSGYAATTGFDLATGLGSANVANLVNGFAGTATPVPVVTLSAASLKFANTFVGGTSALQVVKVQNTGTAALKITGISVTGADKTSFIETNNCPASVAAAAYCSVTVSFKPVTTGALTAAIAIADNAAGTPQSIALSGTAVEPIISFSATSIAFPSTLKGTSAANHTLIVKNTGTAALTISKLALSGTGASSFSIVTNACTAALSIGSTCTVTLGFKPAATGALTASLSFTDNAAASPQAVTLTGTGTGPVVTFSATSIKFAATYVGKSSANQVVTVKNAGTAALTLSSVTLAGSGASSFDVVSKTCGASLAVNATCTVTVGFKPTANGALAASLDFTDNANGSPQAVALSGTGAGPVISFSTTSLTFAATAVNAKAATQTVTVKNTGFAALDITGVTLEESNPVAFSEVNTCLKGLAPNATCTITVTFAPKSEGAISAYFVVSDNAPGLKQNIGLKGTGVSALVSLSATTVSFPSTTKGTAATGQTVTVKNTGNATLGITSIALGGTDATSFSVASKTCGSTLAAAASCTVTLGFKPAATGSLTASLGIADSVAGSPQKVALAGTGK